MFFWFKIIVVISWLWLIFIFCFWLRYCKEGEVSLDGAFHEDHSRSYNLWVEAENKFGVSTKVELSIIVKAISSSAYAGSDMTVLEYQTFMLRANIDDINMNAVESYQWLSEDTDKIICTPSNENCSVEGLEVGEYEAIFSLFYKNGDSIDEKIKIKVIPDFSNNIVSILKEGVANLSGMKVSKDGTKLFVIGNFEDDSIFKIIDVSNSETMTILDTYTDTSYSPMRAEDISFSVNENEDKIALADEKVVILDISDANNIQYISTRSIYTTRISKGVKWYSDTEVLIHNYSNSSYASSILLYNIYQFNQSPKKSINLSVYPYELFMLKEENLLIVSGSSRIEVFDMNTTKRVQIISQSYGSNWMLDENSHNLYYNTGYSQKSILGLKIEDKTLRDINLSKKSLYARQEVFDVKDNTLYSYRNMYGQARINEINVKNPQEQYISNTLLLNDSIKYITRDKNKRFFIYTDKQELQIIEETDRVQKSKVIDELSSRYLAWSHDGFYAYIAGKIYDWENIYNIKKVGEYAIYNGCYPNDCGGGGEEGLAEKLRLNYFWLSYDDSKISFLYRGENNPKKYLSMDIGDTENSIQLEDTIYDDYGVDISRKFILSENERYVYTEYTRIENTNYSYGIEIMDRDTQNIEYFRVGEDQGRRYENFALSRDNQTLYALYNNSISKFSIENKKKITSMSKIVLSDEIYDFSYDPLTNTIFTMIEKGVKVIDALDNTSIYYYATIESPKSIAISPDGTRLGLGFNDSVEILNILEDKSLERHSFIWYPWATYDYKSISFKNNNLLFSDGYIIELSEEEDELE